MPAHIFVTSKGEIVLTYGRRQMPMGIRARISRDNGHTWSEEIVLREDGLDWDLGYPSTTENGKGELVTVYYMKDNKSGKAKITNYAYTPIFTVHEEEKPLKILRIDQAVKAYEENYLDTVSEQTYNKMVYALERIKAIVHAVGQELQVTGPFNLQLIAKVVRGG